MLLSWSERAERVRAGETALASAPIAIEPEMYQRLFQALFSHTADCVVLCDTTTGVYYEVSGLFCELTGYPREELLGQTSATLGLVDPDGVRVRVEIDSMSGRPGLYENVITRKDGTTRIVEFSNQPVGDGQTLVLIRDITTIKAAQETLRHLASTDPLTQVLNRRSFREQAEAVLAEASEAVLVLADIDHLKMINDTWGHAAGDEAIVAIANALVEAAGPGSLVGRLGGDEFAALLTGGSASTAAALERLTLALSSQPLSIPHKVSASVGVASQGGAYEALQHAADEAMYERKRVRP